jgi:uncharacterized protein
MLAIPALERLGSESHFRSNSAIERRSVPTVDYHALEEFVANKLSHFAIHADDVERAKRFYSKIFEWDFKGYGPPDFWQIMARGREPVPMGAIQSRRYNVIEQELFGFECSFAVADVEQTARAVEAAGGAILMSKTAIPHVGWVIKFRDSERNVVDAVQYDRSAR